MVSSRSSHGSSDPLLALVRWLNGVHAGTMTPNLNTDWIQSFDPDNVDHEESYTVEWRKPPMPRSGWPLYDCKVIEVSRDLDFLRRRMRAVQAAGSDNEDSIHESTPRTSRSETEPHLLKEFLNSLRDTLTNSGISQGQRNSSLLSTPDESQNVTKVGNALVISNTAYILAKAASSPSAMTMCLVRNAFSRRRLRRSSYAGQKRNGLSKPGLKQYRKMQDIQDFVKSRFPYFSQAAFGSAVNSCVGSNVDRERVRQLRDESESEDEN